ncbi:MAG: LCP family protein [Clostridia bacterium]
MTDRNFSRTFAALLAVILFFSCMGSAFSENMPQGAANTFNLLLIGVDAYKPEDQGRSDAMILAQITPQTGDIKLVSFLRDLYVPIPGKGKTRLNAAYFYGGEELLIQTLADNFGVRVDRTLAVNFSLMVDLIDQLGGVEVELSDKELKQLNSILKFYNQKTGVNAKDGLAQAAGLQRLTGKQALSYSRIRKMDSDFKRTSRQHVVLLGILKQLTTLDFPALAKLATDNLSRVKTNIQLSDINTLLPLIMNAANLRLRSVHVPFDGTYDDETINGMMVLTPNISRNRSMIAAFLSEP